MKHEEKSLLIKSGIAIAVSLAVLGVTVGMENAEKASNAVEASADAVTVTGIGQGLNGDVVVEVIADSAKIYSVKVLEHSETEGIGTIAVEEMPGKIVESQNLRIDGISGCTVTSDAIKEGVGAALKSAGIDAAAFGGGEAEASQESASHPEETAADNSAEEAPAAVTEVAEDSGEALQTWTKGETAEASEEVSETPIQTWTKEEISAEASEGKAEAPIQTWTKEAAASEETSETPIQTWTKGE